jgi:hypothetical protein
MLMGGAGCVELDDRLPFVALRCRERLAGLDAELQGIVR